MYQNKQYGYMKKSILSVASAIHIEQHSSTEKPKRVIMFFHGLTLNSDYYKNFTDHFESLGYLIVHFDLRGHGKSIGKRVHIKSFDEYIADTEFAFNTIRSSDFKDIPKTVVCHSMGALIFHKWLEKNPEGLNEFSIDSMISLSGAYSINPVVKFGLNLSPLVSLIAKVPFLRNFSIPKIVDSIQVNDLSDDNEQMLKIMTDKNILKNPTFRLYSELLKVSRQCFLSPEILRPIKHKYFVLGKNDRLINVENSQEFYKQCNGFAHIYENIGHCPCSSKYRLLIFEDIDDKLNLFTKTVSKVA